MSRRVLVVSPHEDRRVVMEAAIAEAGYEVLLESNQGGAFSRVHEETPDAVIIDVNPGDDGAFHLVHSTRSSPKASVAELPFVVSAGRDEPTDRLRAWEAGCDAWFPRPHHIRELLDAAASLIDQPPADRARQRAERVEEERRQLAQHEG